MPARALLNAVVQILAPLATVRPGLAGMIVVDGVPVMREQGGRLVLLAIMVGTERFDARTVGAHERPERIAAEVLDRIALSRPVAA